MAAQTDVGPRQARCTFFTLPPLGRRHAALSDFLSSLCNPPLSVFRAPTGPPGLSSGATESVPPLRKGYGI